MRKCMILLLTALFISVAHAAKFDWHGSARQCDALLLQLGPRYEKEDLGLSPEMGETIVRYLRSAAELKPYGVKITSNGSVVDSSGRLVSTEFGKALFVVSQTGQMYISRGDPSLDFRHSSFLAGKNVWFAGEIEIHNGQITEVTASSGHYRPGKNQMFLFLTWLNHAGVKVDKLTLGFFHVGKENNSIVAEFSNAFSIPKRNIYFIHALQAVFRSKFINPGQSGIFF